MPDLPRSGLNFGGDPDSLIRRQRKALTGDAPEGSIGELLSCERERHSRTLMDISLELKIAPHHLIAIENDEFAALPGRAYAIGFVRSYAAYLGLDAENLVARLKAAMEGQKQRPVTQPKAPPPREYPISPAPVQQSDTGPEIDLFSPPERTTPTLSTADHPAAVLSAPERTLPSASPADRTVWHRVLAGLFIVVTVYWGYQVISSALGAAPPPVAPVPARLAAEAGLMPKKAQETAVAGVTKPARKSREAAPPSAKADGPPAMIASAAPSAQRSREPALMPSASYVPPTAIAPIAEPNRISREPALNPPNDGAPAQPEPGIVNPEPAFRAPLPLGERYGEQNRNSRVTLRVHRPARVAVLGARHHVWIDRTLRAGDTYRVPNLRGLTLNTSDGGAVEVILDDNTVGFAARDGVPAKGLSLQPQNIIDRFHWIQASVR